MWMGDKYYYQDEIIHPSIHTGWNGILKNDITVKNVNEKNLQWLLDLIIDSRPDVEGSADNLSISNIDTNVLLLLRQAKQNIEAIISQILGEEAVFALNIRNNGASRFRIVNKNTHRVIAPTLDSLSTGQIALFNIFSTIVRYADTYNINNSIQLKDITGIVVIDEIDLHLHTKLQKEVLPNLIKLFPKVQFIITSHAPLFLLGMKELFGDDNFEIYEMPKARKITAERFSEFQRAYDYLKETQTYQQDAEKMLSQLNPKTKTIVITEGATDWKHMKTAFNVLRNNPAHTDLFNGLDFEFLEYEPANSSASAEHKLEMGNKTLTNICESYSKLPQDITYIFVADRDVTNTNKTMGDGDKTFKKWSKNVYSFLIPVPHNRSTTPNICIEHLFTDEEIKTEVVCAGVKRRLYIGNEFDERGIAVSIDRFCERPEICGRGKINIIEGSQGDKITSISNQDNINNYALSKMNFAKYVSENPDKFNFDNFLGVFRIIKAIIGDAAQQ